VSCPSDAKPGHTLCDVCMQRQRDEGDERRERRGIRAGRKRRVCFECGGETIGKECWSCGPLDDSEETDGVQDVVEMMGVA